jgi:hypothetical protein
MPGEIRFRLNRGKHQRGLNEVFDCVLTRGCTYAGFHRTYSFSPGNEAVCRYTGELPDKMRKELESISRRFPYLQLELAEQQPKA